MALTAAARPGAEVPLAEWRLAAAGVVLLGAAVALLPAGFAAEDPGLRGTGAACLLGFHVLGCAAAFLAVRARCPGTAAPSGVVAAVRAVALWTVLAVVVGAVVGVPLAFASGAEDATLAADVGFGALVSSGICGGTIAALAFVRALRDEVVRLVAPSAARAPRWWLAVPRTVAAWTLFALAAGGASLALAVASFIGGSERLRGGAAGLIGVSCAAAWCAWGAARRNGQPRRFVR